MKQHSSKEFALVIIGIVVAISIFPFFILHALNNNLLMSTLDFLLCVSCFTIAAYVYQTQKTYYPTLLLTVTCLGSLIIIININGLTGVFWAYPTIIATYYLYKAKTSMIINLVVFFSIIPKLYLTLPVIETLSILLTLLVTNYFSYVFSVKQQHQKTNLNQLAWFDGLTGVNNRRALDQKLEHAAVEGFLACIIVIDIDHFKKFNDNYGHHFGDYVLTCISNIIAKRIRATDTIYRYGGEEFVVVTNDTSIEQSVSLAEEIRTLVESYKFKENISITISLGVAELKEGESVQDWFARGDKALYMAKNTGRNKTFVAV